MLDLFWQKEKHAVHQDSNALQSCLTIYSIDRKVVDDIVDAYLDRDEFPFESLMNDIQSGKHCLYVSANLATASQKLISLKKSGQVADFDGAACHLYASIGPAMLHELIHHRQEFRQYLSEIDGFCIKPARIDHKEEETRLLA